MTRHICLYTLLIYLSVPADRQQCESGYQFNEKTIEGAAHLASVGGWIQLTLQNFRDFCCSFDLFRVCRAVRWSGTHRRHPGHTKGHQRRCDWVVQTSHRRRFGRGLHARPDATGSWDFRSIARGTWSWQLRIVYQGDLQR